MGLEFLGVHDSRLTKEIKPDGTVLTYQYDAAGNKTQQTTELPSGETKTVNYSYDKLNRLTEVTDANGSTTYTYDAVGNRKTMTRPNGVTTTYTYDSRNRLTEQVAKDADGNVLTRFTYTLDDTGRRVRLEEASGRVTEWQHDDLYRLTQETITDPVNGDRTASYTYDKVGNRLTETVNGTTTSYTYDKNDRLTQKGGTSYTYDANGNTVSEHDGTSITSYSYDARDKLIQTDTGSQTIQYGYDINGIRTEKSAGGTTTNYVVDHNRRYAQVLAERENGTLAKSYTYGNDLVSQQGAGGQERFYIYDGLGSTRALADGAGGVTDTYAYEAFGELTGSAGSTDNDYRFTGEQFDSGLGQYYLRARYYEQDTGRFTQMDRWEGQLGDPKTLNKYSYANGDPIRNVDPSGYFSFSIGTLRTLAMTSVGRRAALGFAKPALKRVALAVAFAAVPSSGPYHTNSSRDENRRPPTILAGTNHPEVRNHIRIAQGQRGIPPLVHRRGKPHPRGWLQTNLVSGSCGPSITGDGTGKDCDEFPMAINIEGGKQNFLAGRVSVKAVSSSQNRSFGNLVSRFHAKCGITPDSLGFDGAYMVGTTDKTSEFYCGARK